MPSQFSAQVNLRLTPEQRDRLQVEAARAGITVQDYCRFRIFGTEPLSRPPQNQGAYSALESEVASLRTDVEELRTAVVTQAREVSRMYDLTDAIANPDR